MARVIDYIKNTIRGKTIYRILFQWSLMDANFFINGKVLDIGSGGGPSYEKYLPKNIEYIKTDYTQKPGVDKVLDFNAKFDFPDATFDTVFLFHNLYIAENPDFTILEIKRVLKDGGYLLISNPFTANEMPEPHDYVRFSKEGLDRLIEKSGLKIVKFKRLGDRFTVSAYALSPLLLIWPIRLVVNTIALAFDFIIPNKLKTNYPFPLGYFYATRK